MSRWDGLIAWALLSLSLAAGAAVLLAALADAVEACRREPRSAHRIAHRRSDGSR